MRMFVLLAMIVVCVRQGLVLIWTSYKRFEHNRSHINIADFFNISSLIKKRYAVQSMHEPPAYVQTFTSDNDRTGYGAKFGCSTHSATP